MSLVQSRFMSYAAFALLLGTLAAAPVHAAPFSETSGPPNSTVIFDSKGNVVRRTIDTSERPGVGMTTTAPTQQQHRRTAKRPRPVEQKAEQSADQQESAANASQERDWSRAPEGKMREHVEERIKSLHERLGITPQQEPFWGPVAQAMRDSEARVSSLIQERHENADQMNAVDDLDSFQAIAQAHADGLAKVNLAFKELYDEMPDAQRKNADEVFSRYEGHPGPHGKWKQHRHHKTK